VPKDLAKIKVRLDVDGVQQYIKSATFSAARGSIGAELKVNLMNPMTTTNDDSIIDFKIGVEKNNVVSWYPLVKEGLIAGRQGVVQWEGGDRLSVNALNALADRWRISPTQHTVIYNTDFVDFGALRKATRDEIVDDRFVPLIPNLVGVRDLHFKELMRRIYVDGCRFTDVVTNIDDYVVRRIDVPISSTFHSVAQSYYGVFQPAMFADDREVLYILDIDGVLPDQLITAVRPLQDGGYETLTQDRPMDPPITSVLFTFKTDLFKRRHLATERNRPHRGVWRRPGD
jgi:hypothetical protein